MQSLAGKRAQSETKRVRAVMMTAARAKETMAMTNAPGAKKVKSSHGATLPTSAKMVSGLKPPNHNLHQ